MPLENQPKVPPESAGTLQVSQNQYVSPIYLAIFDNLAGQRPSFISLNLAYLSGTLEFPILTHKPHKAIPQSSTAVR